MHLWVVYKYIFTFSKKNLLSIVYNKRNFLYIIFPTFHLGNVLQIEPLQFMKLSRIGRVNLDPFFEQFWG